MTHRLALLALAMLAGCRLPQPSGGRPAVGVMTSLLLDSARHGADPAAPRPVQLTVWYPGLATSAAAPLTYGDYFDLAAGDRGAASDSARRAARAGFAGFLAAHGMSDSGAALFATPMRAVPGVRGTGARLPLVVIVQGNGQSAGDQSALAERLAAAGYVVATMPSYTRISRPPESEGEIGAGAEEQADDIAFVVAAARRRPDVDSTRVALVAHSLGARGALLYAMRAPVRALVSLDGGIGTATARAAMEGAPSFHPAGFRTPILHVYETLDAFMTPEFTLLRELPASPVTLAHAPAMHHHHFTVLGALGSRVPGLAAATAATDSTGLAYDAVVDLLTGFLDEHLKDEAGAFARVTASPWWRDPVLGVSPLAKP
jgi:dienelactone hydrolase